MLCTVLRTLSDLGGGVNGHRVNLRDKCGVCDNANHIITEIARCLEFCHMSSGWFDCTEPSLSTGKQGVQGAYALVRGGSSTSNLVEPTSLQR